MEVLSEDKPIDIVASKEATYGNPKKKEQSRLRTVRTSSIFSSTKKTLKRRRTKRTTQSFSDAPPSPVRSHSSLAANTKTEDTMHGHDGHNPGETTIKRTKKKLLKISAGGGVAVQVRDKPKSTLSDMLAGYGSSDDDG